MPNGYVELLNIIEALQGILRGFLLSVVAGTTQEEFLRTNETVLRVINEVNSLREQVEQLREENEELTERINTLTGENSELRARPQQMQHQRTVVALLERAMTLINSELQVGSFSETDTANGEEMLVVGLVDGDLTIEDIEDTEDIEYSDLYEAANPDDDDDDDDDDDTEEALVDSEHIDFEDEDLVTQETAVPEGTVVKNPDITEDFTRLDDSHMVGFIFVRYSHLPYHYTLNGVRYKLVLAGSQVVSSAV